MTTYYIDNQTGDIYQGHMRDGDREATTEEVAAKEAHRQQLEVDAKLNKVRALRKDAINSVNGIADRLARKGDTTIRAVGDAVVEALLDITKNPPAAPTLVDAEMVARYNAIVAPLLAIQSPLVSAFAEMDQ
jgi:hypothetical protein